MKRTLKALAHVVRVVPWALLSKTTAASVIVPFTIVVIIGVNFVN